MDFYNFVDFSVPSLTVIMGQNELLELGVEKSWNESGMHALKSVSTTPQGSQRDNWRGIRSRTHEPKWKVNHAAASLQAPKIVHLHEPITGMGKQSKSFLWNTILGTF